MEVYRIHTQQGISLSKKHKRQEQNLYAKEKLISEKEY